MTGHGGADGHQAVDALIVGAGPAGLSAALYLARYNRSVTVVDRQRGRSTHRQVNHNYLGFPEGVAITDLRRLGREQLESYDRVRVVEAEVDRIHGRADVGFTLSADGDEHEGRVVVLSTGVLDHWPHFPGWEDDVGRSMFWCITCDGYENRGRDVVGVGHTDEAAGEALQLRSLTERVRILTNSADDDITPRVRRRLDRASIEVIHDTVDHAEGVDGELHALHTCGGTRLELEAVFSVQGATPETRLARELGVECDEAGYIVIDLEQRTNVPGVFAAGDTTCLHSHQVSSAVHEGAQAASAANHFLYRPELQAD